MDLKVYHPKGMMDWLYNPDINEFLLEPEWNIKINDQFCQAQFQKYKQIVPPSPVKKSPRKAAKSKDPPPSTVPPSTPLKAQPLPRPSDNPDEEMMKELDDYLHKLHQQKHPSDPIHDPLMSQTSPQKAKGKGSKSKPGTYAVRRTADNLLYPCNTLTVPLTFKAVPLSYTCYFRQRSPERCPETSPSASPAGV